MSETINDATIKLGIDASGVKTGLREVEDGAAKTTRSLENLGRSDGMSKLGDGAQAAASKFTMGSKGIIDAIEKRAAAMELGKRGTVEYYTALANQKGVNPALLQPYLDKLQAVTRATEEAAAAQRRADDGSAFVEGLRQRAAEIGKSASELAAMRAEQLGVTESAAPLIARLREAEEAAGGFGGALSITKEAMIGFAASVAGALSIGGFVALVDSSVSSLADLDDMAQKTGSSVETLSRLQKVAQATGQDFGLVDSAVVKLAKGMGGLDEDSNKVISALQRLGISTKDIAKQDPSEVLIKAAKALQGYSDGAGKTALINDLLSKSGADLLPYLNDVAEGVDKFGASSTASAQLASQFGDNIGIMRVRIGEMGNTIAANLLPYMVKFSEGVKELAESQKFKKFLDDTGTAVGKFASFISQAYTVVVPAAKITAVYFAVFVGAPALITATTAALAALYGVVGSGTVALITSGGLWAAFTTTLWGTSIAATAAAGALGKLKIAGGLLFAAFAGWEIGTYLSENFSEARIAGLRFVEVMLVGFEKVKFNVSLAFDAISFAWDKSLGEMKLKFAGYLDSVAVGLKAIGGGFAADPVSRYAASLRAAGANQVALAAQTVAGSAAMIKAHQATLKGIRDNIQGLVDYESVAGKIAEATRGTRQDGPAPDFGGGTAGIEKMKAAYASLTQSIREKIAAAEAEANGQGNLTESQKLQIALNEQLATGKLKLREQDLAAYQADINRLRGQEEIIASSKRALAAGVDFAKMQKDWDEQTAKRLDGLSKEADQNEVLARTFGLNKVQIEEMTLARLEDQLAQRASNALTLKEIENLTVEIAARKRNVEALRSIQTQETGKKANDAMVSDWKRTVEQYSDVFRTGFADMLNNGKDGWKSFTQSLTTTFKTTVADQIYKMFAQPFVVKMVASMLGVTGTEGAGSPGAAPGVPAPGGGIMAYAQKMYESFTGSSLGASNIGAMVTKSMPIIGTAVASYYVAKGIANGYKVEGIGNLLNMFGAVGGTINRLFGRRDKEYSGTGSLTGSFGASGTFSGTTNQDWIKEGGVFRSDKRGTDKTTLASGEAKEFSDAYMSLRSASADFAEALGINADAVKNRTQSMNIALTKDQAANEKAIAEFFTNTANTIARELVPNLDVFAKAGEAASVTLERVATNYAFLDVALESIGKNFGDVGLRSVAARERLVDLVGGLDALGKGTAFFAQNFLTESQRLAPVVEQVKTTMAGLNLAYVDTRDEFAKVVLGLDLTSSSGASTYASLMKVQEAFALVYPAADASVNALTQRIELQKEYDELTKTAAQKLADQRASIDSSNMGLFHQIQAFKSLKAAQDASRTSTESMISQLGKFGESAKGLGAGLLLGDLSTMTQDQQYAEAKRQYEGTLAAAKGGDVGAQDRLSDIATKFLEISQRTNGGDSVYAADFAGVIKTSDEIAKWTAGQIDVALASLDAQQAQLESLAQINLTLRDIAARDINSLIPPPPRPFSDGPNYNTMGTLNMAPLVEEVKALREQVKVQTDRADQAAAASIEANHQVTLLAARIGSEGVGSAMVELAWQAKNSGKVAPD